MIYIRNKDKVILNNQSGYLMRTKVSSSNEGGVAAGFAVLDSVLLTDEVITTQLKNLLLNLDHLILL